MLGSATAAVDAGGGSLPSVGGSDALLVKLRSSDLGHIWSKRPGASQNDYGLDLEVADDGDVVIVGVFTGTMDLGDGTIFSSTLNEDAYALRYTSGGSLVGAKQFGGLTNQDRFQGVAMSGDHVVGVGYFYNSGVYGSTTLTSAGMADAVIARFSL